MILNDDFSGRGIARIIIMLPWAVSLTMTRHRLALDPERPVRHAQRHALRARPAPQRRSNGWPTAEVAFPAEIAVGIVVSIPFTTTILLGGLSACPSDIYEAARIDGATGRQRFRHLTLPLLRPFINIAIVLNIIYVFNSFPIIWVMTQGDPANSTDILVT